MQHMVVYYILHMAFFLIFMLVYSQTPYKQLNRVCECVCIMCVCGLRGGVGVLWGQEVKNI